MLGDYAKSETAVSDSKNYFSVSLKVHICLQILHTFICMETNLSVARGKFMSSS